MITDMNYRIFILAVLFITPVIVSAQTVQSMLITFTYFIGRTIIPVIIAIAFLFFLINAVRYFIIEAANEDGRKKAKRLAIWGILAFVIMLSIWSIVGFITSDLGLFRPIPVCPDYMPSC